MKKVAGTRSVMESEPIIVSGRLEMSPDNVWHKKYPIILHSPVRTSLRLALHRTKTPVILLTFSTLPKTLLFKVFLFAGMRNK
jgi:hypothetical protein